MPKKKIYTANIGFHFTGTVDIHANNRDEARLIATGMTGLITNVQHRDGNKDIIDWNVSTHCDNVTLGYVKSKY